MILLCVSFYAVMRKSSNFEWFGCIGIDGKDWIRDRGSRHVTFMSRWDATIINNKGLYVCLRPTIFTPKCDYILSNYLQVWEKETILSKIVEMGVDLL